MVGGQDGGHRRDARQGAHRGFCRRSNGFHGFAIDRVDFDGKADIAVFDHQTANHALSDDVLARTGVDNCRKCLAHIGFGYGSHG